MSQEEAEVCCLRSSKFLICRTWVTIMGHSLKRTLNLFLSNRRPFVSSSMQQFFSNFRFPKKPSISDGKGDAF